MKLLKSVISDTRRWGAALLPALGVLICSLTAPACESVYDDPNECLQGLALRFVYEYHMMRGANAFTTHVDCVTLYVFDKQGNYVTHQTETSEVLQDPNYRMILQLQPGEYDLVAYGGISCPAAKFDLTPNWNDPEVQATKNRADLQIELPRRYDNTSSDPLFLLDVNPHDNKGGLFYGARSLTMPDTKHKSGYIEETVEMMNDVNDITVILQELDKPAQINYADYEVKIVDDNFRLDCNNNVIESGDGEQKPAYLPYFADNITVGYVDVDDLPRNGEYREPDESDRVQVACAEFSTSRLVMKHITSARLIISRKNDTEHEHDIIDVPLIEYLLMCWTYNDRRWMKDEQEFLDRQNNWTLIFFMQHGLWWDSIISINNWVVRLNNIDDFE